MLYIPNFKWHFSYMIKKFKQCIQPKGSYGQSTLGQKSKKTEVPIAHDIKLYYKAVSSTDSRSEAYTKPQRPMKQINK